jgi:hypothetical protein
LSVIKTFVDATGSPIPIQPPAFNIQVACNPNPIPPTNLPLMPPATATSSNSPPAQGLVQNLPVVAGETCTVSEPVLPAIPATAQRICGNTAHWDSSPAFTPSATIPITAAGPNVVTVTNTLRCNKAIGSLVVKKLVVSHVYGTQFPSLNYTVNVTCGGTTTTLTLTNGGSQTVSNIPYGTSCSVAEFPLPTVPPQMCPSGTSGLWTIGYVPPQPAPPIVINGVTTTVTVTNTFNCVPDQGGSLIVTKAVANHTDPPVSTAGVTFPVTVTCGGTNTNLILVDGTPQTVSNIPINTSCSVAEGTPTGPTSGCSQGYVPAWLTTYLPTTPVTITTTPATITVQNSLYCMPSGVGSLVVAKTVTNTTQGNVTGYTYPVTVTCGSSTTTLTLVANTSQTVNNIPFGTSCAVTENTLSLQVPANACTPPTVPVWSMTTVLPSPVLISGAITGITVQNKLDCKPAGSGSLIVTKEVVYAGSIVLPSHIYPVTVTCGSTITHLNLVNGVPQTVSNIPLNTSCSVVEVALLPPPNICPPHTTPLWTTAYAPPSPIHITGMGIAELVKNTLTCSPMQPNVCPPPQVANVDGICVCPLPMVQGAVAGTCMCPRGTELVNGNCVTPAKICAPPLVLNIDGVCGCPPGTVLRGKECVRPIDCRAPLIPNAAGTECDCGRGLVLRGGKCVAPIVCKAPATLNSAGTACQCPKGMVGKGTTCVEPEHNIPGGIPGLGGRGGEGAGPRGGGEGSSPGRH